MNHPYHPKDSNCEIIKEFREKFPYYQTENEQEGIESFLLEKLASEYARGVKDGESTKNGMQRYLMGVKEGREKNEELLENIAETFADLNLDNYAHSAEHKCLFQEALQKIARLLEAKNSV